MKRTIILFIFWGRSPDENHLQRAARNRVRAGVIVQNAALREKRLKAPIEIKTRHARWRMEEARGGDTAKQENQSQTSTYILHEARGQRRRLLCCLLQPRFLSRKKAKQTNKLAIYRLPPAAVVVVVVVVYSSYSIPFRERRTGSKQAKKEKTRKSKAAVPACH